MTRESTVSAFARSFGCAPKASNPVSLYRCASFAPQRAETIVGTGSALRPYPRRSCVPRGSRSFTNREWPRADMRSPGAVQRLMALVGFPDRSDTVDWVAQPSTLVYKNVLHACSGPECLCGASELLAGAAAVEA